MPKKPFLGMNGCVSTQPVMEERFMASARKRKKQRRRARKLGDCVRQFLTPAVWKQVQNGMARPWRASRWRIQPLVMVLVLMTFACGDSQEERFECARAVVIALLPKATPSGEDGAGFREGVGATADVGVAAGCRGGASAIARGVGASLDHEWLCRAGL